MVGNGGDVLALFRAESGAELFQEASQIAPGGFADLIDDDGLEQAGRQQTMSAGGAAVQTGVGCSGRDEVVVLRGREWFSLHTTAAIAA